MNFRQHQIYPKDNIPVSTLKQKVVGWVSLTYIFSPEAILLFKNQIVHVFQILRLRDKTGPNHIIHYSRGQGLVLMGLTTNIEILLGTSIWVTIMGSYIHLIKPIELIWF